MVIWKTRQELADEGQARIDAYFASALHAQDKALTERALRTKERRQAAVFTRIQGPGKRKAKCEHFGQPRPERLFDEAMADDAR